MEVKLTEDDARRGQPAPQVRVTNKNDFDIEDHHDGVPYAFPGRTYDRADTEKVKPIYHAVTIPPDAAAHIFGYGVYANMPPKQQLDAMFKHIGIRLGWNTAELQKENKGREFFRNIDIRPVMFRLVEETPEVEEARAPRGKSA